MGLMNFPPEEVDNRLKSGKITICVVGLGRIGLPTAAVFAKAGAKVIGVDIDQKVVDLLNSGKSKFADEPGLDTVLEEAVQEGKLSGTTDIFSAVSDSDALIICVPTPVDETKVPDYSSIIRVCKDIGASLRKDTLVIVESTVGPGTVESVLSPILEKASELRLGVDFEVASCPERADPGRILTNLLKVPRIVGALSPKATKIVSELYKSALGVKVVEVRNPKTANAVKLTENLFRDVNIALANEFAILYEKLGIDTIEVIQACSTKYNFMPHYPGAGVGGPCLPSNPYYLMIEGIKVGNIPFMVRLAREINDRMPDHVVTLVTEALNDVEKTVRGSKIAILGVAYKPDIHDVQLTPIQRVFKSLKALGARVTIYDPMFKGEVVFGKKIPHDVFDVIEGVDCVIFGTAHSELKQLKLTDIAKLCDMPAALVDTQNLFDPRKVREAGFAFRGVGRPFLPSLE